MNSPGSNNALNRSMQGLWTTHRKSKMNINSLPPTTPPTPDEKPSPVPAEVQEDPIASAVASPVNGKRKVRSSRGDESSKRAKTSSSPKDYVVPTARIADLGGVKDCIEKLLELVAMPLCHPEVYLHTGVQPPRGVLLHGPPGCGKTLLAHAIAGELGVPFISISAPSIVSGMSGESEKTLRDTFDEAKRAAPCLLFIDEIDAITPKRESAQREMERRIVAQFLTCMDDLSWDKTDNKPIIVMGATNRPDSLDAALRRAGRFDHEISMGVPDEEAREQILKVMCAKLRLEGQFDFSALAKATPGYVGADLAALTGAAGIIAVKRIFKNFSEGKIDLPEDLVTPPQQAELDNTQMPSTGEPSAIPDDAMAVDDPNSFVSQPDTPFTQFSTLHAGSLARFLTTHPDPLTPEQLAPLCITHEDFHAALSQVQPSSKREGFATAPGVTWADVGALASVRGELQMAVVQPIRRPDVFAAVGITRAAGVLLWGPPGCGKTLLARAVASESCASFVSVKGPELLNKYVGESERAVRQVFARARASAPCVVFFDELDALVPRRDDSMSESSARVVNTLLTELDGLDSRGGVYVLGATNRPDMIDPAMVRPGRLDKLLYVDLPDADERAEIVRTVTRTVPLEPEARPLVEDIVRQRCDGYSGADLASVAREAGVVALKRSLGRIEEMENAAGAGAGAGGGDIQVWVTVADFDEAVEKVGPSVSAAQRRKYDAMRNRFAGLPVRGRREMAPEGGAEV
ncbi:P-loop containing nucleoside triphosphate hydrolase protein [Schizophyllum amplum]|uniref:Peroxisomal ATPase PEX1 n=1 Tax=Schizophyllum amplum TaxID=97359 RepID=A0A550CZ92_9AGAR|nr:P-loop containing nucleoside triphosphate hydrolase protein [Auriculariopsis ampla]